MSALFALGFVAHRELGDDPGSVVGTELCKKLVTFFVLDTAEKPKTTLEGLGMTVGIDSRSVEEVSHSSSPFLFCCL